MDDCCRSVEEEERDERRWSSVAGEASEPSRFVAGEACGGTVACVVEGEKKKEMNEGKNNGVKDDRSRSECCCRRRRVVNGGLWCFDQGLVVMVYLFIWRTRKKWGRRNLSQNVKVHCPLNAAEQELYGWVEEAIFTQPSVVLGNSLPELRHSMWLTEDDASEGDFVLEAASPSDRLPLRANGHGPHFLWVYQELFTRLGVRLPFTDFQREVMTRCRVAVS
ncbi:hypothetical protein PIB30_023907 [Stylosanthes scabra]|uniref:Uncharacterized protein n=1 Tax=Stylosanthes scabra TaxID=79078 RepID=A0ABU6U936_9FABA|nr:hypothetical protein [Stylosanthes scabra]